MLNIKSLIKFWLPPVIWGFLIFTVSNGAVPKVTEFYWPDFVVKKSAHIIEYMIFCGLIYRAIRNTLILNERKTGYVSIIIMLLYSITDEFHQTFISTRNGTLRDVIIDFCGGMIALIIIWKYLPKAPKPLKSLAKNLQII